MASSANTSSTGVLAVSMRLALAQAVPAIPKYMKKVSAKHGGADDRLRKYEIERVVLEPHLVILVEPPAHLAGGRGVHGLLEPALLELLERPIRDEVDGVLGDADEAERAERAPHLLNQRLVGGDR